MRRGQFARAEPCFRAAIKTQTRHNPNPQEGEPHYNLGLCLRYLGRSPEAYAAFYKAAWNAAWQDPAYFQLAQLASQRGGWPQALEFIDRSLERNSVNQKGTHLKMVLLRKLGRSKEARQLAEAALTRDPLDFGARNELALAGKPEERFELRNLMQGNGHAYLAIAADYSAAGFHDEALELLECAVRAKPQSQMPRAPGHLGDMGMPNARPMLFYFLGYYAALKGDRPAAIGYFKQAARQNPVRCFPNSLESILALQTALRFNPRDAHAGFCLGNLWYDKRQVPEATACWESAARCEPTWPTVHRNLALVYFNKQHAPTKALRALERAFALDPTDARVLFELDLLKKRILVPPGKRLAFLHRHRKVVDQREDLLLELITLLNFFGRHEEALDILMHRQFHPWEGGEGNVTGQYVVSLVELAKRRLLSAGRHESPAKEAIALLERARTFPSNLGEGKLHGARENPILYWLGAAWEQLGETDRAHEAWREAATGLRAPTPAVYYNDQNPETIFYQGLARQKLGWPAAAKERFETLVQFGKEHLHDRVVIDYFAVSLPEFTVFEDDLNRRNQINCRYLKALGAFGLGRRTQARRELAQVRKLDPSHLPTKLHTRLFDNSSFFRLDGGGRPD